MWIHPKPTERLHLTPSFTIIFQVDTLTFLEQLVERLIEGPFDRLFKPRLHPADLARALAGAMEQGQVDDGQGRRLAPNDYQVALNEADYQAMQKRSEMVEEMAAIKRYLADLMLETGCYTRGELRVLVNPQPDIAPGKIEITADHRAEGDTRQINSVSLPPPTQWRLRLPERTVQLGMPVVRLGRHQDNDIVLAEASVSRYHAQLRWRNGVYFAQNLSHSQVLRLNGNPVRGTVPLKPGDTLQLGRVTVQVELNP